MDKISGTISTRGQLSGQLSGGATLGGGLTIPLQAPVPVYAGAYEFTPTQNAQTIAISGLKAAQDIIIDPIPSNYGLVTWNGSFLRIS